MKCSTSKRNTKIFLLMSQFIGSKTPSQCRSHHQKFYKKICDYNSIERPPKINNPSNLNLTEIEKKPKRQYIKRKKKGLEKNINNSDKNDLNIQNIFNNFNNLSNFPMPQPNGQNPQNNSKFY